MDRRENLKLLIAGGLGSGLLFTAACKPEKEGSVNASGSAADNGYYGRIPEEIERDKKVMAEAGFNANEMAVISALAEIIVPVDKDCIGAKASGVPAFIDFIAKDIPSHKLPLSGGVMWIDNEALTRFGKTFVQCDATQQIKIVDDIAYPDTAIPEYSQGVKFFNLMRNLTLTGYFTSKEGLKDLGYQGNVPNEWDGVPADELAKHGVDYNDAWKDLYIKKENRSKIAQWDDKMNLI
jgi:hypothetical protein